jgi:hypothetical protein
MLAIIEKVENGHIARFERHFKHYVPAFFVLSTNEYHVF